MDLANKVIAETSTIEWRTRHHLVIGRNDFSGNVLKTDVLIFEAGAELYIGQPDAPYIAIIAKVVHMQDAGVSSFIRVARQDSVAGENGNGGPSGTPRRVNGSDGQNGTDASGSSKPPPFLIFCEELTYQRKSNFGVSPLLIDADGGHGAVGGDGGDGGDGHIGHRGWPGLSVGGNQLCP